MYNNLLYKLAIYTNLYYKSNINNNLYYKSQTYSNTYLSKIVCKLQDSYYSRTILFQYNKIKLHNYIERKKRSKIREETNLYISCI